jgi:hypothetical protein
MFRVKVTRRNVKRATSPLRPATDVSGVVIMSSPIEASIAKSSMKTSTSFEQNMNTYFAAETASVLLSKPWLRLERGLRLQKFRTFSRAYPGLTEKEQEALYSLLVKANDAKLLNTKQQINYEMGVILSVKGLKMIRVGAEQATFKIDVSRPTKKNTIEEALSV